MKILLIFIIIISSILVMGCTDNNTPQDLKVTTTPTYVTQTPTPTPAPEYIMCGGYSKVTDRYKTPDGFYIVADNITVSVDVNKYNNISIGNYAKLRAPGGYGYYITFDYSVEDYVKSIVPVTEKESGYRMACKITR